jgi:hypothetical protein
LFLTKEVIQGTAFGLEGLKVSLINYQTALADFLFAAPAPPPVLSFLWVLEISFAFVGAPSPNN